MSTKSGAGLRRTGPQKHQNTHVWKFDQNKTDPKTKLIQNVVVTNCCEKCTGVIEWKRKYGKYKPLSAPSKCIRCLEKRVKFAYHVLCAPCVRETRACAKCRQTEADVVNKPQPTLAEAARMEADFQKEMKLLPERKRRTFLRYLRQQEKKLTSTGKKKKEGEEWEEELEPEEEVDEGQAPKTIHDVHQAAFEKLKGLREKYGRDEDDFEDLEDFDADDLDDLDLSDEDDEDDED